MRNIVFKKNSNRKGRKKRKMLRSLNRGPKQGPTQKDQWGLSSEIVFFTRANVWRKILTVDILMNKGWIMIYKCNLRKANEESIDQVMIHSEKMSGFGCFTLKSFL